MSFLAPIWLAAAAAAALGAAALHFITTQRPPASPLPTARFVPLGDARAASRAARPTDLLLLLMRCVVLLLLGAAFAGPVAAAARATLARVIVVDRSRAALSDVRDSALVVWRDGGASRAGADVVIAFDSAAAAIDGSVDDSLHALAGTTRRGSLTAALVSARRAAAALSLRADSIELVIVSPLATEEIDAASAPMIARWPGRVRLVRTGIARPPATAVTLRPGAPDDPLEPLVAALNAAPRDAASGRAVVRVVRGALSPADSSAARGGAAVVSWPPAVGAATAQGVWAGTATLVAPLTRLALPAGGQVIARWADGTAAAAERPLGSGCMRDVGIGVPATGDVSLQPAFMSVARTLLAPCGALVGSRAAPDSVAHGFPRGGPAAAAPSLRGADDRSAVAPWLLAAALLLLAAEMFVRRSGPEMAGAAP